MSETKTPRTLAAKDSTELLQVSCDLECELAEANAELDANGLVLQKLQNERDESNRKLEAMTDNRDMLFGQLQESRKQRFDTDRKLEVAKEALIEADVITEKFSLTTLSFGVLNKKIKQALATIGKSVDKTE